MCACEDVWYECVCVCVCVSACVFGKSGMKHSIGLKGRNGEYKSFRAAKTKYHRPGGLNNRNFFSYSSGAWKSKVKVLARLVLVKPLSLARR